MHRTLLLLSLLVGAAEAQQPTVSFQATGRARLQNSTGIGRMRICDFDGDVRPDLVGLVGGQVRYVPMAWGVPTEYAFGSTVRDFVVTPGAGQDDIVYTDNGGLWRAVYGSGSWSTTLVEGSNWLGALHLDAAGTAAGGASVVVGALADQRTIAVTTVYATPVTSTFLMGYDILDVVALDWILGGAMEMAVLTVDGVEILSLTGQSLANFRSPNPGNGIARVSGGGSSPDKVAWATSIGATEYLVVLSDAGTDPLIDIGPDGWFSLVTCDADNDGDEDLLVTGTGTVTGLYFENRDKQGGPTTYTAAYSDVVTYGAFAQGNPNNVGHPAFGDLDNSGIADIAFVDEITKRVVIHEGDDGGTMNLTVDGITGVEFDGAAYREIQPTVSLDVRPTWTHLQVVLYRRDDYGYVDPNHVGNWKFTLADESNDDGHQQTFECTLAESFDPVPSYECWFEETHWDRIYYFEVRGVRIVNGSVVGGGPPLYSAVSWDSGTSSFIINWEGYDYEVLIYDNDGICDFNPNPPAPVVGRGHGACGGYCSTGNAPTSFVIEEMPDFPPSSPPQPGDPQQYPGT